MPNQNPRHSRLNCTSLLALRRRGWALLRDRQSRLALTPNYHHVSSVLRTRGTQRGVADDKFVYNVATTTTHGGQHTVGSQRPYPRLTPPQSVHAPSQSGSTHGSRLTSAAAALDQMQILAQSTTSTHSPLHKFLTLGTMAGSKRNRVKKMLSPTRAITPPPPIDNAVDDDGLMDDLLAQLDSRDGAAQQQSAAVLHGMNIQEVADDRTAAPKQDSKARHKARQVRLLSSQLLEATSAPEGQPDDLASRIDGLLVLSDRSDGLDDTDCATSSLMSYTPGSQSGGTRREIRPRRRRCGCQAGKGGPRRREDHQRDLRGARGQDVRGSSQNPFPCAQSH